MLEANCPVCGRYYLAGRLRALYYHLPFVPEDRGAALTFATRQSADAGQPLILTEDTAPRYAAAHVNTRVEDNLTALLKVIARRAARPGSTTRLLTHTDYPIIDLSLIHI